MNVIYKYEVTFESDNLSAYIQAPENIKIIRFDYVDDDYNKGYFCWGIVDLNNQANIKKIYFDFKSVTDPQSSINNYTSLAQIPIKEKNIIVAVNHEEPIFVKNEDGFMFVYFKLSLDNKYVALYDLYMLKTGQKINEDLYNAKYLGILKIFIGQELGLYVFAKEKKVVATKNSGA